VIYRNKYRPIQSNKQKTR